MAFLDCCRVCNPCLNRCRRRSDRELQSGDISPARKSRAGELADETRQLQGMELKFARSNHKHQREVYGTGVELLHWCGFWAPSAADREQRRNVHLDAVHPGG